LEGTVILELSVDEKGAVTEVEIKERAGHGFDEAAAAAARRFRFRPGTDDKTPVPSKVTYAYRFVMREAKPPAPPPEATPSTAPGAVEAELPVRIRGRVLARGTRAPIAGAHVVAIPEHPPAGAPGDTTFEAETDG